MSPFIGGGFGGKLWLRADALLAALGARAARRPVKVALHAAPHVQQHGAPAGNHPAHPHRRHAGRQDHGDRPRELVRQPAGRQARERGPADAAALCRRQPPDRDSACAMLDLPEGNAMRAPGEAPGMMALEIAMDEMAEKLGLDPDRVPHPATTPRSIPQKPERPFSQRQLTECLRTRRRTLRLEQARIRSPARPRDGRWLVGMGVAAAFRNSSGHEVGGARAPRRSRHRDGRDRHDRHRHRQLHHHRPDRGRDDGRAARTRSWCGWAIRPSRCRPARAGNGAPTARPPASTPPA